MQRVSGPTGKYKDWILQGVLGQDHAGQPSMREDPEYHGKLE